MKKIAIFNRKGGVGKSVSCVNLAGCLDIIHQKDVLVVDCDAQINTTTCLSISEELEPTCSVKDIFSEQFKDYGNLLLPIKYQNKKKEMELSRITLVPASRDMETISTDNMYAIKDFLEPYESKYDYCLLDCPPSLTDMTINALCAADYLLIPTFAGRDSVNGYGMVVEEIDTMKANGFNVGIKILGTFLNSVDKRKALENYYVTLWKKEFHGNTFKSQIRESSDISNAYEFGKPIHYYKPKSQSALDYEELTKEIISKIRSLESRRKK